MCFGPHINPIRATCLESGNSHNYTLRGGGVHSGICHEPQQNNWTKIENADKKSYKSN
jgi:hypothetical protein